MKTTFKTLKDAEKSVGNKSNKRSAVGGFLKFGQKIVNGTAWIALKTQAGGVFLDEQIDGDRKVTDVMVDEYKSQLKERVKKQTKLNKQLKKAKKTKTRKELRVDIKSLQLSVDYYQKALSKARK